MACIRFFLITILSIPALSGWAEHIRVCPDCPVRSIQEAVQLSQDGDTILVEAGTYLERNILIDKEISLIGKDYPILDGENDGEILTIIADNVLVEGLQIQNVGTSYLEDCAGIRIKKADYCTVRNNKLVNTFFGIYGEHCMDAVIEGNSLIGNALEEMSSGNAIHFWYSNRIEVIDNYIQQHRDGIYFEFVDDSFVKGNESYDNLRYGLHFMFSNDDNYFQNTFGRNGAGVAVMFSKCINMWENKFVNNWGRASYGLLLKELTDTEIWENEFVQNTIGILVEGSSRIHYHHNTFQQNGWAMKISGGCLDNLVIGNNYLSNSFDVSVHSHFNNNLFYGNFWSEYSGYDLDKDGVGDVAYRPMKLFNYVVDQTPEAMVLLRSLFIDLVNFSEKVSPVFTPRNVVDSAPSMTFIDL